MISASMLVEGSSMMKGFSKSKPGSRLVLKSRLIAFFAISLGILESTCFNVATARLNSSISTVFVGLG